MRSEKIPTIKNEFLSYFVPEKMEYEIVGECKKCGKCCNYMYSFDTYTEKEFIKLVASAEDNSLHPIATAIKKETKEKSPKKQYRKEAVEEEYRFFSFGDAMFIK